MDPQVMKRFRNSQVGTVMRIFQSIQKSGCKCKASPYAINHIGTIEVRFHMFLARDSNMVISVNHRPVSPEEADMVPVEIIIIIIMIIII